MIPIQFPSNTKCVKYKLEHNNLIHPSTLADHNKSGCVYEVQDLFSMDSGVTDTFYTTDFNEMLKISNLRDLQVSVYIIKFDPITPVGDFCDDTCSLWGYSCNINEHYKECKKIRK